MTAVEPIVLEVWEGDTRPVPFDLTSDGQAVNAAGVTAHKLVASSKNTRTDLPHTIATGVITWTRTAVLAAGIYSVVAELTDATGTQTYPSADSAPITLVVKPDPAP